MSRFLLVAALPLMVVTINGSSHAGSPASRDEITRFMAEHYPPNALARGEQGMVGFKITVERDGSISACEVTESSGFATLDRETCDFVAQYLAPKPVRDASGQLTRAIQPGHIVWLLPAGAKAAPVPTATLMPKPDKLICKRNKTVGSIIATKTLCMTDKEWAEEDSITQTDLGDMLSSHRCASHGC